jgi:GT2 family glycosyltransferase
MAWDAAPARAAAPPVPPMMRPVARRTVHRLWTSAVEPLLAAISPSVVVEVGSDAGHQSVLLATFCAERSAQFHIVDPAPAYDPKDFLPTLDGSPILHSRLSVDALPQIEAPSAVLIDGDHNYYTVRRELEILGERPGSDGVFPLVLLHDVAWPYGRRDLYYDPATIPDDDRLPWRRGGLRPDLPEPSDEVAFNAHLANAITEGTPGNGVLTAVEDVLAARSDLHLEVLPVIHGLGIVYHRELPSLHPEFGRVLEELRGSGKLRSVLEAVEAHRLAAVIALDQERRRGDERVAAVRHGLETARGALEDAQSRADSLEQAHEEERSELAAEIDRLRAARAADEDRIRDLEAAVAAERRRFERLRNRRVVRVALRAAALAGPAFRLVRRRARTAAQFGSAEPQLDWIPQLLDDADAPPQVTVIVPVYNAVEELERLVASLQRHVATPDHVLFIDDASPDQRVRSVLERVAADPRFSVLHNEQNLGFTRTVNRGLASCDGDVIVLNSDTVIGPKLIRNLQVAAYRDERTAIVTPLSDNAGAFSAPAVGGTDAWPSEGTWDDVATSVRRASRGLRPEIPTGHGFCMYIRRAALDEIGELDAEAFPRGYGEENDLSLRARAKGWRCVLDDRSYVHHAQGASFGDARQELIREGRRIIDARYPSYTADVAELKSSPTLVEIRATVRDALDTVGPHRPRVLSVIHDGGGGTPQTNRDLMRAISDQYETRVLRSRIGELLLERPDDLVTEWSTPITPGWRVTDVERADMRRAYAEVLGSWDVDLLHIRHLIGHTFDLPRVARALRIPVVLSLHDFYLSCPTIHLLDETGTYCGGICTSTPGQCEPPTRKLAGHPPLKHRWVHEWRSHVASMFRFVDTLVTTTPEAVRVFEASFPGGVLPPIEVIEHGRDFPERADMAAEPDGGQLRVLLLGNIGRNKGGDVLDAVRRRDSEGRIQFHFLGAVAPAYEHLGVLHGTYDREQVVARIGEVRPHVVAILSTWPETYSHTLTEAWAAGVPVIASELGALKDRIATNGGGWFVDPTDADAVYRMLIDIAEGRAGWAQRRQEARDASIRSIGSMADAYRAVYERVLAGSGTHAPVGKA